MDAPNPIPCERLLDDIRQVVGDRGWTTEPGEIEPFMVELRGLYRGKTAMMVRPDTTEAVAEVVRLCQAAGVAIVPQGGNTSLCGGSIPFAGGNEILLSLSRLNRIRAIDPLNYTITVEAGCVLANIQAAAADADRLFPLSLGAEGSCQIGGNLSTNAGGINTLKFGNTRDLVLGIEVVLPDGTIWNGLRSLRKDNTGYDLKQLFIGAEGTLGIITAAVLKLFPRPREEYSALVAVATLPGVIELLSRLRVATGDMVTAFEMMPRIAIDQVIKHIPGTSDPLARPYEHYALLRVSAGRPGSGLRETLESTLADAMEDGLVLDATIAESEARAQALWRIRETIPEAERTEGGSIKHDISVPVSRMAEFIETAHARVLEMIPGARPVAFGHVGDGNVHFNISQPVAADRDAFLARWGEVNDAVHHIVAAMGGSISAEHGVGRLKRDEITHYKSAIEIDLMRRIKSAIDPQGIMNPGKVL